MLPWVLGLAYADLDVLSFTGLLPAAASRDLAADGRPRPSIVLILVDTLRNDAIGIYGHAGPSSPELDALARRGLLFRQVVAQCSWTRPSAGSLLTGCYPRAIGLYRENEERLADRCETLAEILGENGYTTIGATANPNMNAVFGFDQGFDLCVDSRRPWQWMTPDRNPPLEELRRESAGELFERLLDAVGERPEPPYYVQVNVMEVHSPKHLLGPDWGALFPEESSERRRYLCAVRQVSRDIGSFVRAWTGRRGLEDTLFLLVSDHGEALSPDHPGIAGNRFHGLLLYESQVLVPLVLYHPEGRFGTAIVDRPVRNLDVVPTLLDLLDIDGPADLDGVSLAPVVTDPSVDVGLPPYFVTETYFRKAEKIGVYAPEWRYFENRDGWEGLNPRELQAAGGGEAGAATDRIAEHPDIADELARYLAEWEQHHPLAPAVSGGEPTLEVREQLRALGYID